jgi:hypothetical protein
LQDAGDAVALADGVIDEAVEVAVELLEIQGFLGHQAGQVVQPQRHAEKPVDSSRSTPLCITASIFLELWIHFSRRSPATIARITAKSSSLRARILHAILETFQSGTAR